LWRLDPTHGNVVAAFDRMGRPDFPSREQLVQLREAAKLGAPESLVVRNGRLDVQIPPQGLLVIEVR